MSRAGENNGSIDPVTGREREHVVLAARVRADAGARIRPLADLFAFAPFSQVNVIVDGQPEIEASAQLVSGNVPHRPRRAAGARAHC